MAENMTSAVGKKDPRLLSLICPEKQWNWSEIITCDLETITVYMDLMEACLVGYRSIIKQLGGTSNYVKMSADEAKEYYGLILKTVNPFLVKTNHLIKQRCYDTLDEDSQRKIFHLNAAIISVDDANENKQLKKLKSELAKIYTNSVMNMTVTKTFLNLNMKSDMLEVMNEDLTNEPLWRAVWYEFRNKNAPKMRPIMIQIRNISNKWATLSGWKNTPDAWAELFEISMDEYKADLDRIVNDFMGLYEKIHAYVRHKLSEKFPDMVEGSGLIPMHLTRHIRGENWQKLIDLVQPYEGNCVHCKQKLTEKFGDNFTKVVEMAEGYFRSIGFPQLPAIYYERSYFFESNFSVGDTQKCMPFTVAIEKPRDDVRTFMCGKIDYKQFYYVFHEMGHVYYYHSIAHQTIGFYQGANPAFQEALGDTIWVASRAVDELLKAGLVDQPGDLQELRINQLMFSALRTIPFVFFAYAYEKWTFDFFDDVIGDDKLNEHWWNLVKKFQGLTTPDGKNRGEEYFDIGAFRHLSSMFPLFSTYLIAVPLQFQFLKAMCVGKNKDYSDWTDCDISGKPEMTEKLREMLKKGSSVDWKSQLKDFTGDDYVNTKPTLEYYKPLEDWLDRYIQDHGIPVGWTW
ncbi:angiotensin-converting enzyme-related protein-like [Convolutriloba macropyga]|uniref:angiotensin-converting enzyme-related protein-like n=1 Tax=Convolutriloba macropyga TaxID=536237 RepID=UPI003F527B48